MARLRSIAVAIAAIALSAGAVAAFTSLPDAASTGLDEATEVSGKALPARPAELPTTVDTQRVVTAEDLPDAASHGVDVSTVAKGDDPTPDTNRGADVSAVAKDNHGQSVAADHVPEGAGKPEGAGQPEDPGPPEGAGKP